VLVRSGLSYHVFTPLKRGEGQDTILVNRGFVKREFRDPKARPVNELRAS
jgi:surfeit locus 1 family protein